MTGDEGKPADLDRADRMLKGNAAVASGEKHGRKSEGYTHKRPVHGYC